MEASRLESERIKECFLVLDRVIDRHEFIVGNMITAADVMI